MKPKQLIPLVVAGLILLVAVPLAVSTYYINFWPTDSHAPYIPAASKLFSLPHISSIHDLPFKGILQVNMRGKDALILGIAVMQKILHDPVSLYPNILLLIISFAVSCWLVFALVRYYFDEQIALITFLFFISTFWTYMYILLGAHQPLALMNFLLAAYCLTLTRKHIVYYFLSGFFLIVMLFSSPTAPLFVPYYAGLFLFNEWSIIKNFRLPIKRILFIISGAGISYLLFTFPHPVDTVIKFINYINWSRLGNNFTLYHAYLQQFFTFPPYFRGAGLTWVLKYFFLIMPILFPAYLAGLAYLWRKSLQKPAYILVIFLSLSSLILVETVRVVQFGRNYFTWVIGIIGLLPFLMHEFKRENSIRGGKGFSRPIAFLITSLLATHIAFNVCVFFGDIFPARMSTTNVYQWCIKNHVDRLYIYQNHPLHNNTARFLNNPKAGQEIQFQSFLTIRDVPSGYIMIPPINGKTIFVECRKDHFLFDPYLTELIFSGQIDRFTVKKFKTVANSRYWNMEEEICAHRDLTLGQVTDEDREKGYTYILDARKLQAEWFGQKPKIQ